LKNKTNSKEVFKIDINRAQEIIKSKEMINVNYRGIPVYIQAVHENKNTATIYPLDEMDHVQEVDVQGLEEVGPNTH